MNKKARLILESARDVLMAGDTWTQNNYARTAHGRSAYVSEPEAYCFCAIGAMRAASYVLYGTEHCDAQSDARDALEDACDMSVAKLNDDASSVRQVIALFNRALGDA
jgi:hypothetical protein